MIKILVGDALARLRELPSNTIHTCITSPPYWGLRDYGVEGQIGLEPIPDCLAWATGQPCGECYICHLVAIFREVRRVLHPSGTCWINIGDSYAGSWGNYAPGGIKGQQRPQTEDGQRWERNAYGDTKFLPPTAKAPGLKPKDLCMIPARLALALQADGWWLRSDIVWHKPNCMPESVTDRCSKSHEYIFMLTKNQRYFYDNVAVMEEATESTNDRDKYRRTGYTKETGDGFVNHLNPASGEYRNCNGKRNRRSVWTIPTSPLGEAHFATFPPDLVTPMVRAGSSERGCCAKCGNPWERVTEKVGIRETHGINKVADQARGRHGKNSIFNTAEIPVTQTTGWQPTCKCDAGEPIPCVILDCFGGAGTTGLVASRLARDAILIELSPIYAEMARRRIYEDAPLLVDVEVC